MEATDIARELRIGISRLRRRLREVAALDELTPSQTAVLSRLMDGPQGTSDLAAAEGVRPQSMAATVAVLEERGFLDRRQDPDDGRRQLLALTDEAHAYISDNRALRESWLAAALDERYSAAERRTIAEALRLLERLTDR
jgi:DNA-binding MarR family transcriptional regulator